MNVKLAKTSKEMIQMLRGLVIAGKLDTYAGWEMQTDGAEFPVQSQALSCCKQWIPIAYSALMATT